MYRSRLQPAADLRHRKADPSTRAGAVGRDDKFWRDASRSVVGLKAPRGDKRIMECIARGAAKAAALQNLLPASAHDTFPTRLKPIGGVFSNVEPEGATLHGTLP